MPVLAGRLNLPYPAGTASADVPADILALDQALEAAGLGMVRQGLAGNRPSAGTLPQTWWYATDTGAISFSTGTTWIDILGGGSSVPVGGTIGWPWAAASIPAGYAAVYGQALNRTTYAALHALALAAGYPYGAGDGSITFGVPDERGRVEVGKSDMGGINSGRLTVTITGITGTTLGATAGAEGVTLTTGQMPAHNHSITDPGHYHTIPAQGAINGPVASGWVDGDGKYTNPAFTGITIQNSGGGGAHANMPPFVIVNKIMRIL